MNVICLTGRLTRDPETRTTTGGKNVCSFSLAVNKQFKPTDGSPDADFFNCVAWGNQADFITNYLGKGRLVSVEGRLQSRKYTTTGGETRDVVEIVVNNISGLDRPTEHQPARGTATTVPSADEYDPWAEE